MHTSRRVLIVALVIVLLVAFVPLGGRLSVLPCSYVWRYVISYGPSGGNTLVPENAFPHFPPRCHLVIPDYAGML